MNLPDLMSWYRIVIAPIVVLLVLIDWPSSRMWVAVLTTTAWLSDMGDGFVARTFCLKSDIGPLLDWTADKIYVLSVLIALVAVGQVPAWITIIIVIREIVITQIRYYCAIKCIIEKVGNLGKLKLGTSMLAIIAISAGVPAGQWILYLALVLTILSGMDYVVVAIRHLRTK